MTTETIDETARRIVGTDVLLCVSALVSTMSKACYLDGDAAALIRDEVADEDTFAGLAMRSPTADEYREAAAYDDDGKALSVTRNADADGVYYDWFHDAGEESVGGQEDSEVEAWRAAFDHLSLDTPDGSEVFEYWVVTDWLAGKLEARGETVARDVAGLTIWGRATTGQAIYMDSVLQDVARAVQEA